MHDKKVTHIIVNNLGGITSLINNLIDYKGKDALPQELILLNIKGNTNAASLMQAREGVIVKQFSLHPRQNWYHVYKDLANTIGTDNGVLVSNDVYDLIMLSCYNIPKQVVQIVHDAYNVKLSVQYEEVVDAFICHSIFFHEMLCQLLPHRRSDIYHIPYGIPLAGATRQNRIHNQPLRLLFLGRHDKLKGIFDLYPIHQMLQQKNIPVNWLILGKGPETDKVKAQWKDETAVRFYTPATYEEVMELAACSDIFVFPTRFEGFPVALTETMSVGCVPVVSDLPGGIRELVQQGETGFRCTPEHIEAFVEYIAALHSDRPLLERMSIQACDIIRNNYNASIQSPKYQALFTALTKRTAAPRHHSVRQKIGSRLDQPWLPGFVTKYLRKAF